VGKAKWNQKTCRPVAATAVTSRQSTDSQPKSGREKRSASLNVALCARQNGTKKKLVDQLLRPPQPAVVVVVSSSSSHHPRRIVVFSLSSSRHSRLIVLVSSSSLFCRLSLIIVVSHRHLVFIVSSLSSRRRHLVFIISALSSRRFCLVVVNSSSSSRSCRLVVVISASSSRRSCLVEHSQIAHGKGREKEGRSSSSEKKQRRTFVHCCRVDLVDCGLMLATRRSPDFPVAGGDNLFAAVNTFRTYRNVTLSGMIANVPVF
jgi:hypothetical protein